MQHRMDWGWHWFKVCSENVYYVFCVKTRNEEDFFLLNKSSHQKEVLLFIEVAHTPWEYNITTHLLVCFPFFQYLQSHYALGAGESNRVWRRKAPSSWSYVLVQVTDKDSIRVAAMWRNTARKRHEGEGGKEAELLS